MSYTNEYEAIVNPEAMPPCPICGKPISSDPQTYEDRLMVFFAHGMAALGHDGCRPSKHGQEAKR